jgi:transcriptional pleiotropic regulator of transition state genes
MKSTGIVRRIDDLGRVVIPKEIRRNLDIAESDPMEIYVDGDRIMLRKYEPSVDSPKSLLREVLDTHVPIDPELAQRIREAVK